MLEGKRVVHAPMEIAGQVGLICDMLREYGLHATGYNYFPTYLKYSKVMNTDAFELVKIFEAAYGYYDLFHFQNGYTFLEDHRDLPLLAKAGKAVIMHHRGNDVRSRKRARSGIGYENPYVNADCSLPDEVIDRQLRFFAKHVSAAIVQDDELLPYVEDYYAAEGKPVYKLPRLFDLRTTEPAYPSPERNVPLVVHAPTQRDFKGTDVVVSAVERLKEVVPLKFVLVEGMSHEAAMRIYREADIVIDQVLCGAYGNLSVEAMALGKPVVCYIREDLKSKYPAELPIESASPDELFDVLKRLIEDGALRRTRGTQGRAYVEKHHAADSVIRRLLQIYEEVLTGGR